jgi:signal transduction histidine kinase
MKTDQKDTSLHIELGFQISPPSNNIDNQYVKFWVKDFGDGIPDEKKPFLFQEFSRLQTSQKRGYGLGLSIVKSIIIRSGGAVGVESQPGQGSCFYFTLPTKPFVQQHTK